MRSWLIFGFLALGLLGLLLVSGPTKATAAGPLCQGTVQSSRQLVIDCTPGYVGAHDVITLVSHNKSFKLDQDWQSQLDYGETTWIYDTGARGRASLIIDFHHDGAALVADLYDDGNNDGQVMYQNDPNAGSVRILENLSHWTMRVVAKDGWWTRQGLVNFNLDISVDGPVRGNFNSGFTYNYATLLKTDGTVDYEIHVRDTNHNGRPDYEWRQDRAPLPEDARLSGQYRTEITHDTRDDEPALGDSFFWPYLNFRETGYNKLYGQSPAPIQLDWSKARLTQVAEFVASRGNPGNYFIYSLLRVKEGQLNSVNFESPFAFYDLAEAHDGWPDTTIRVENALPKELLGTGVSNPGTSNIVEYAWGQQHNHSLNYQVSVAGRHPITSTIQFPEFGVKAVPYDQLPGWVAGQAWDAATFVEVEKQPYWTGEVIYEYNVEQGEKNGLTKLLPWGYVLGRDNSPPTKAFNETVVGQRGEYLFDLMDKPYLYFSAVDHKLHLLKAEGGVWNIDGTAQMRYDRLGKSDFIDQWTYTHPLSDTNASQPLTITTQLNAAPGYLLYSDSLKEEVILRQASYKPDLFRALPPTTPAEWKNLSAQVAQNQTQSEATDLKAMLGQFDGSQMQINGATFRDYRPLGLDGFQFVLKLTPGFHYNAPPGDWLNLENTAPGEYLLSYSAGQFKLEPLTPAEIHISKLSLLDNGDAKVALAPQQISVEVENTGRSDTSNVQVELHLDAPNGASQTITGTLPVLGGQQTNRVALPWTPNQPGQWKIRAVLNKAAVAPTQITVAINPAATPDFQWTFQASGADLPGLLVLLAVTLCFCGGFGLIFGRQAQALSRSTPSPEDSKVQEKENWPDE